MPPRSAGSWARRTYVASVVAFAGTLAALGAQMRAGADPVIGAAATPAPVAPRPHVIVTRKIVKTTVITKKIVRTPPPVAPVAVASAPAPWSPPSAPAQGTGAGSSSASVAAPVARSAPAPAPPAAAPAPAPAAAPVTRAS